MAVLDPALDSLVREQQEALRALRAFVDALRDAKKAERVDEDVRRAIGALPTGDDDDEGDGDGDLRRFTAGMQALMSRLGDAMRRIDDVEAAQKHAQVPARRTSERPPAPAGLLSLRDYSVLQAAMEVFFCWSVFPLVEPGVFLPIDRRRPTKTLDISRHVLLWGSQVVCASASRVENLEASGLRLVDVSQSLLQLLSLPQIQPILLPKYAVELIALLVYGEKNADLGDATNRQCEHVLSSMLKRLPLRLSMASLRGALGQSTGQSNSIVAFKKRCGQLLTKLIMEDGGVQTTIEMLLGAVEEGNTQARMQVATLICQCPSDVEPSVYAKSLSRQVRGLFDVSNRQNKLLRETGAVVVNEMLSRYPKEFDSEFMVPMFTPLLVYEDAVDQNVERLAEATESEVAECVGLLHLLLCGPPPSKLLVEALSPVFRPLVHLFGFALSCKSFLKPIIQETLVAFLKVLPHAGLLLQLSVLPVVPPLRQALVSCGLRQHTDANYSTWSPAYEFHAGGTGGVAMRLRQANGNDSFDDDPARSLRLALAGMVEVLSTKDLESSPVVGELFSSLLLTYMSVRKSDGEVIKSSDSTERDEVLEMYEAQKIPRDSLGVELTVSLLLAIIESLGPSVLRSAEVVLQCLTTVLGMFAREVSQVVDIQNDESFRKSSEVEEEDDDDEILTVCLGVVITILEAGASRRSDAEEAELRAMLPVLEQLSQYPRPQISELATNARVSILSRGIPAGSNKAATSTERSFEQTLSDAEEDLKSPLVPLRARGVVALTKLVRASQSHRNNQLWIPRITLLLNVFMDQLGDSESYVYLAAVQGLAALSDAHPDIAISLLTSSLRDKSNSTEKRIKLSEALLFSAKRCGDTLPKYAKLFVHSYLECIRPPPLARDIQKKKAFSLIEVIEADGTQHDQRTLTEDEREAEVHAANAALADATLRASCLSNLAEVSALLQWSLEPFTADVLSCVYGILQLEIDMTSTSVVAVRRGAVFLIKYILQLMGHRVFEVLPGELKPMYHTLKHVERVDKDEVVRFHAQRALQSLDQIMRAELFPQVDREDSLGSLHTLRIVKH